MPCSTHNTMCSPTSLEGSRLVRIVVPYAQTRVPGSRGHRDAFLSERREVPHISTGLLKQATEPRAKQGVRSVLYRSVVVDSTFEQSKNIAV